MEVVLKACVHFNRGRYSEALELYKEEAGEVLVSGKHNKGCQCKKEIRMS
ncbi:Tesmin/TSO1-like CXC domain-containing protein [Perilla frutescens var. frutescens]|nr:Tesmin/TSO1-like CXC domain-containing protein [Perilla frutescens var. frutescens]